MNQEDVACSIWIRLADIFCRQMMLALLIAGALALSVPCFAEKAIDNLDGYYSVPSAFCDQYQGKRRSHCIKTVPRDCLLLKHLSADTLHLDFASSDRNAMCSASGVARVENGRIIYREMNVNDKEMAFEVLVSDRFLTLKVLTGPVNGEAPFCGVHGDLDGFKFKRSMKSKTVRKCDAG